MNNLKEITWDEIKAINAETSQILKEAALFMLEEKRLREEERKRKEEEMLEEKRLREEERKRKEEEMLEEKRARIEERKRERDEEKQRKILIDKERDEDRKEFRAIKKEICRQTGGISHSNGELAETYFYNSFKAHKIFANETYDYIQRPVRRTNGKVEAEFDIVLFNGTSVAIIEVKYRASRKNLPVPWLLSRTDVFKTLYPEYRNHKIFIGVAAMSFSDGFEKRMHRNGIATIRQIGKKMVVYDQEVRAF